mmetsp:Transcript_23635/g.23342  ORF Transcript_23635/g.23342 Transcript_23635/m.23342 type:complete len:114 (+) Transcript_23635:253-594(+)
MSLEALDLLTSREVVDADVASPISTSNMLEVWTAPDASEHLLILQGIEAVRSLVSVLVHRVLVLGRQLGLEVVEKTLVLVQIRVHIDHPTHILAISVPDDRLADFLDLGLPSA